MLRRYVAPVGLAIMILFAFILLAEALRYKSSLTHWLCTLGWFIFAISLIVSYYSIRVVNNLEFRLEQDRIINIWPKNNIMELDLSKSYFCTIITCEYCYGKATTKKSFFLFNKKPFDPSLIKGYGLSMLENINKNEIIIIPKNDVVDSWVKQVLKLNNIPTYPAVAFKP